MRTKASLVPNLNCKTRKIRTKIEKGYDNKLYQKLMLNISKVIEGPTSIYTPWGLNSRKPPWKLRPHVWPMTRLRIN
jgi:hypothetical protein